MKFYIFGNIVYFFARVVIFKSKLSPCIKEICSSKLVCLWNVHVLFVKLEYYIWSVFYVLYECFLKRKANMFCKCIIDGRVFV